MTLQTEQEYICRHTGKPFQDKDVSTATNVIILCSECDAELLNEAIP